VLTFVHGINHGQVFLEAPLCVPETKLRLGPDHADKIAQLPDKSGALAAPLCIEKCA